MANIQIPNLPAVASLSGAELFEGVQAGTSVKISLDQVIAASRGGTPTTLPLAVSVGGTGADNPADARTNLGLGSISTQNSNNVTITGGSITGITDLAVADGGTGVSTLTGYVKGNGTSPFTASATVPSTDITGLGTMSVQNANNVTITGGSITGITDLAVADGGTGVSTLTGYVKGSGTTPLTASATIPNTDITGLGTMSVQDATSVTITGGSINGTSIGASSASTIKATTGNFSGDLTLESAQPTIVFAETDTTDIDARVRLNGGSLIFDTATDGGVLVQENMRIKYTGDIGIGTASPTARLDIAVNSASDAVRINQTGAGNALVVEDSTSPDSTPFVVSATGSVGIGTTTPAVKLDVVGSAIISGDLTVDATTLHVDAGNDRVGVGTITPGTKLDVVGTANATNMTRGGSQVYSRDNILAAVSQSAGVPTGGIIERGSSANGEYVRYADGTMICVIYAAGTQTTPTASGSIFRATNASTWTFPSTFAVAPAVSGMAEENNARWVAFDPPTTTSVAFRHLNSLTSAVAVNTRLMAIGRWF